MRISVSNQAKFKPGKGLRDASNASTSSDDEIDPSIVARRFGVSTSELAEVTGLSRGSFSPRSQHISPEGYARLRDFVEIIERVSEWAGGAQQAVAWYRAEPIPALGDRTAESLVRSGQAQAVRDYIEQVALGAYA
jgi:uncharacterized protein (DUF2384 family)